MRPERSKRALVLNVAPLRRLIVGRQSSISLSTVAKAAQVIDVNEISGQLPPEALRQRLLGGYRKRKNIDLVASGILPTT
jgi:hypothetical protein